MWCRELTETWETNRFGAWWVSLLALAQLLSPSAPVITKIFNCSLKHQNFPFLLKQANVSPIPKESLTECDQLRPISLTNITVRIYERLVCKQELSPILKSAIGPDQFAHKKGHNTTIAIIFGLSYLTRVRILLQPFHLILGRLLTQSPIALCANKMMSYDIKNRIISFLCDRWQSVRGWWSDYQFPQEQ